MRCHAVNTTAM